jgi:hypothetical protein
MNGYAAIAVLLAAILLSSTTLASAATLWDFVIQAELEQAEIGLNEKPVVSGKVLDQVLRPVSGVDVTIRFSNNSVTTTTASDGSFSYEFGEQTMPGTFTVNIFAKSNDKKGFAKLALQVGKQSTSFNEIYYKTSEFSNQTTTNDPYADLKLKHYLKFLDEQNKRLQKQYQLEAKKLALEEKRNDAQQRLYDAIEEKQVGAGIFAGKRYEDYILTVNPKIRDTVSSQLNYTKQLFEEARQAMKEVLDNGGSLQEARKVYFEKLSVTKDELNNIVDANNTENHSKIKTKEDRKINSKKVKGLTLNKNLK